MHLHISPADGVPIYQQIVQQIKAQVTAGRLAPGEELPPIRVLADQLLVNANTVARAYRELAEAGVLTNRRTAGTIVADGALPRAQEQCLDALTESVDTLLAEARRANLDAESLIELVRKRDQLARKRKEKA
jgi:GntR family transcriptional regulator